ncbi:hypothetical protein N9571_01315 [Yoonia sp.]|nr:hypothetical protein [Yoonia sp.]
MAKRTAVVTLIVLVLLGALIFSSARLVLPACGLVANWFGWTADYCPRQRVQFDTGTTAETERSAELLALIRQLERELADQECAVIYDDQAALAPDSEGPDFAENSPDQILFEGQDIAVLEGCWQLEQSLTFENRTTREETVFNDWQMCFDENGQGQQTMTSADGGITCTDDVPGQFDGSGALVISETENLQCSDGSYIYRRDINCTVDDEGFLSCRARQPELNLDNSPFRMRRE